MKYLLLIDNVSITNETQRHRRSRDPPEVLHPEISTVIAHANTIDDIPKYSFIIGASV